MLEMTRKSLRFESFTLDLERLCLQGPAGRAELRPKSFKVLRYLIEHAGRVVNKEELLNAVWPDVTVSDESLTQCIRDVRRALGGEGQWIVKTVPRRGYLVDVVVSECATTSSETAMAAMKGEISPLAHPGRPSIAVLAFTNMGGDPSQDYFSDGITEDIITELSRFSELLVIARNSSFQYKGRPVDVRQIGRELGVRYVLEGSIRRSGDRVRISAQLVDAVTGAHRWAERYDRKLEDVFAVQDEVARTIVAVLALHVNKAETERVLTTPPATWQAYEHYLRAADTLVSYHSSLNKDDLLQGRRGLRQVLTIDPNYARAHASFSRTYVSLWVHRWDDDCPWSVALDRAYQSACEAVRLAPNLPAAHVALGWALIWMRQHEAAIAEFERAIGLNPNLSDPVFAWTLVFAGEPERAIQTLKPHMRLNPFYQPQAPWWLGGAYYMLKRYAEALPHLHEGVSRAPNEAVSHHWLAATYAQLGQLDKARAEAAEGLRIDPWFTIGQALFARTCKRPEDAEHFQDGLRKAGYPE
jgi:adenylate cyclase